MKVSYDDYNKFLDDLAKTRKVDLSDIKNKMADCGAPGVHNAAVIKICVSITRSKVQKPDSSKMSDTKGPIT